MNVYNNGPFHLTITQFDCYSILLLLFEHVTLQLYDIILLLLHHFTVTTTFQATANQAIYIYIRILQYIF